jgi:CRP/FNR family transcriptional regulator, cyclic AMP receptor protein
MPDADIASEHTLGDVRIFSEVPMRDRQDIEKRLCRWVNYKSGELVIDYLDKSDDVFFVISGQVSVTLYSLTGRVVSFRELGPGQTFGELAALDGAPRSASVHVRTEGLIAHMTAQHFREVLHDHPSVALALLRDLVKNIRNLTMRVYEFSTLAVSNRLQAELLRLAKLTAQEGEGSCVLPMPTHEELASRISTHREAVTRELSHLANIGIIERQGRKLVIKDLDRLNAMVHDAIGDWPG